MTIVRRFSVVFAGLAAATAAGAALAQTPPAAPAATPAQAAATRPAEFEDCAACHTLAKGEPASIGPNLWGVGGRKAGSVADYPYSPAMKAHAATWTPETLTPFIQRPTEVVPGTSMAYPGIADPAAAKAIADYLMTLHD